MRKERPITKKRAAAQAVFGGGKFEKVVLIRVR
jgi:hypothetical protein